MAGAAFGKDALRAFFGTTLTPFSSEELQALLASALSTQAGTTIVGHHNLHSLYLLHHDRQVAAFYARCHYCYVDGMPILWLLRLLGVRNSARRFTLMDCLPELLGAAEASGWRICYLGGTPAVIERAEHWFAESWPSLAATLIDGYGDDENAFRQVAAAAPDLLLIGMGMPKQEAWIIQHADRLPACVVLQAGGTLDYYTGAQVKPPAALSRLGLGGLYRLAHDPGRLWRRYLLEPWALLGPVLRLHRALHRAKAQHRGSDQR